MRWLWGSMTRQTPHVRDALSRRDDVNCGASELQNQREGGHGPDNDLHSEQCTVRDVFSSVRDQHQRSRHLSVAA